MSVNVNVIVLGGNLTRDPEIRPVNNTTVANFTLAMNRRFKKSDGSPGEETTFVNCEAWDSGANLIGQLLKKGDPVLVEGEWKNESWEKDGQKFYRDKVRVARFQKLSKKAVSEESTETVAAVEGGENIPF